MGIISSRYPDVALFFCPNTFLWSSHSFWSQPGSISQNPPRAALQDKMLGSEALYLLLALSKTSSVTLEGWDFTGISVGHSHTSGLWWNSGFHRAVPPAEQSQCFLKSLLCRVQPCNADGHKPWHLPQVFFGGSQQLLFLFCPPFKHWKLRRVAIYSRSHGDKQMATVPER